MASWVFFSFASSFRSRSMSNLDRSSLASTLPRKDWLPKGDTKNGGGYNEIPKKIEEQSIGGKTTIKNALLVPCMLLRHGVFRTRGNECKAAYACARARKRTETRKAPSRHRAICAPCGLRERGAYIGSRPRTVAGRRLMAISNHEYSLMAATVLYTNRFVAFVGTKTGVKNGQSKRADRKKTG